MHSEFQLRPAFEANFGINERITAHRISENVPGRSQGGAPEWIKVSGAVRQFSIGRTLLYELIGSGVIKTALIRKRGNIRGCRLISTDSLRQYIEGFVEPPDAAGMRGGRRARRSPTGEKP